MRKNLLAATILGAALAIGSTAAHADIITALASTPVATGDGFYAYTYNVQLSGGQLDAVTNGTPVQFGTVYDFGALATTSGAANNPAPGTVYISMTGLLNNSSLFTFSFAGTTSPADTPTTTTTVNDDPGLTNIRFTYIGGNGVNVAGENTTLGASATTVAAGTSNLGTFTVYSPTNVINPALAYDGQTYKGTNDTLQANFGQLSGPQVTQVPEPASLALLGMGLVGTGLIRRRRK